MKSNNLKAWIVKDKDNCINWIVGPTKMDVYLKLIKIIGCPPCSIKESINMLKKSKWKVVKINIIEL